jgi:hypothetical protein
MPQQDSSSCIDKGIVASIVGGISLGALIGIVVGALLGKRATREGWHEPDFSELIERLNSLPLPGRSAGVEEDADSIHA